MASKVIQSTALVVVIVCFLTIVESVPTMKVSSEISSFDEIPKELPSSHEKLSPPEVEDVLIFGSPVILKKRSVVEAKNENTMLKTIMEDNNKKIISEEETDDDLETAAGTNVLRPLFVYRQQLAYRERVRKAGRRSAPNFS